eukprot:291955-Amorphochlora_amoeboformis.AAC.1
MLGLRHLRVIIRGISPLKRVRPRFTSNPSLPAGFYHPKLQEFASFAKFRNLVTFLRRKPRLSLAAVVAIGGYCVSLTDSSRAEDAQGEGERSSRKGFVKGAGDDVDVIDVEKLEIMAPELTTRFFGALVDGCCMATI